MRHQEVAVSATIQSTPTWEPLEAEWASFVQLDAREVRFEVWLERWSGLEGRLSSLETELHRQRYADTSCIAAAEAFERFHRELMPQVHQARGLLVGQFLEATDHQLGYLWQRFSTDQRLQGSANKELLALENSLSSRYSTTMGGLKAKWQGQTLSLPQLAPLQAQPDRDVREVAWRAEMDAKHAVSTELGETYLELLRLRERIAQNAGFANYLEYRWLERGRFDYSPKQCLEFVRAVDQHFGPLQQRLTSLRRENLKLDTVQPWDMNADIQGRAALSPYSSAEELVSKTQQVLESIDPTLSSLLMEIQANGNLEIEARVNKSPALFTDFYYDRLQPLIFISANGTQASASNLIHELGHAYHWTNAAEHQRLFWHQSAPIEFFEATAQALELIALNHLSPFYDPTDVERVKNGRAKAILHISTNMLAKEVFQHWVYQQPAHSLSVELINQQYLDICQEFSQSSDYSGLEKYQAIGWQSPMVFGQPLYSVEYSIAWVGALLFYQQYLENPRAGWENYQVSTRLGMTEPLPKLFDVLCGANPLEAPQVEKAARFLQHHFDAAFAN